MNTCLCGCGDASTGAGDFVVGHSLKYPVKPRYLVDEETGCWVWQRMISNQGYAMTWSDGRNRLAHRIYYARHHGVVPPTLDHTCRNRRCVNPAHLEPCSRGENVRRGDVALLDWDKVSQIRSFFAGFSGSAREAGRILGPRFGVSAHTIRHIIGEQRWPESDRPELQAA